jgi:acyl-CoA thioester hydrolase
VQDEPDGTPRVSQQSDPNEPPLDLRSRATFRHWTRVPIRYSDLDPIGHVNNTGMPMFFEETRLDLIYPLIAASSRPSLELVLVRTVIEYVKEIGFPETVEVGSRIGRIGTKSFVMVHGVFDSSGRCVGTGECTLVVFDRATRASAAPPDDLRQTLLALGGA